MKLTNIRSSDLPDIDPSVKECINLGQWMLFKSSITAREGVGSSYYLKAGSEVFELSPSGEVLSVVEGEESRLAIDELFYFSDLDHPRSISNAILVCA